MNKIRIILTIGLMAVVSRPLYAVENLVKDQKAPERLSALVQDAFTSHPRAMAARANYQAATKRLKAADNAVYNPELELDTEEADNIRVTTLELSQTIDWGDRRGSRTAVASAGLIQARQEYVQITNSLLRDFLGTLAENQTQKDLAELSSQAQKLMQEFSAISAKRYRAGDLSRVELNLASLALSAAIINQAQAMTDATNAREKLRALYNGLPVNLPELPNDLPKAEPPQDMDSFVRSLPVSKIREAEMAVASNTVKLRRSERSWDPTVAVRGGDDDSNTLIGLTLTLPLNVRNDFSAEVEEAEQELTRIKQAALQDARDIRADVTMSTEQYRLLLQVWNNWQTTAQTSISEQLDLIKRLWRTGDMSTTDYLVQLKQAIETQAAGIELRGRLWQSGFEWMTVTASIDNWLNINTQETN